MGSNENPCTSDEIDAEKRAQEATVAKFERLLASYARSRRCPRQCMVMQNVENALLALVDKGASQPHPDRILVALAGVVGEVALSEFMIFVLPLDLYNHQEECHAQVDRTKESAIDRSATWLASGSWLSRFAFWKHRRNLFAHNARKELLRRLLGEYFPLMPEAAPA